MADRVAEALFGKTRRNVLALLFGRPDEDFYLRQVAREAGVSVGAVQHELARLTHAELITRTPRGKHVYFRANRESPVFDVLQSLMEKTAGAANVVRSALEDLDLAALAGESLGSLTQASPSSPELLIERPAGG